MSKFVMLVGPAGSGKSTAADKLCENNENYVIVSSDAIRGELYGDESIQDNPSEVFELCRTKCVDYLKQGKDVIFDATNLTRKRRKAFLNDIKNRIGLDIRAYCTIVASTYEDCLRQNKQRERKVPEYIINRHFSQFQMPLYSEGWDNIDVVSNSNVTLQEMLEKCRYLEHNNHHHKYNVYEHILRTEMWVVTHVEPPYVDFALLRQLALWHDVGKVYTKVFKDRNGSDTEEAHFYNHESWSSIYCLCDPSYRGEFKVKLAQLVSLHMMKYQPEYEKFVDKWCPEYRDILELFNSADAESA